MRRHIISIGGGIGTVIAVATVVLLTDIPKALQQADKSFAYIARTTFGATKPPEHAVSQAWSHPWVVAGVILAVFAIGVLISWQVESFFLRRKKVTFQISEDSSVPDDQKELIRLLLEKMAAQRGHTVSSTNQSGGITAGEVHVHHEDTSLKRQLRDLLALIDGRILSEIDGGVLTIETRMSATQFASLERLAATPGSGQYIYKADITRRYLDTSVMDGMFGPSSGHELIQMRLSFAGDLRK